MKLSAKRISAEIPTASMADIAFLLIVFFMLTTVFSSTKGLEFVIPKEESDLQDAEQQEAVHIKVLRSGEFLVDGKPMQLEGILPYLRPKLESWPDKPVIITTDPHAPYGVFLEIYDQLRHAEKVWEGHIPDRVKNIAIPTLREIELLKRRFGEDIFG